MITKWENIIKVTRGIGSLSVKGQNRWKIQDFRIINNVEIFHEYCLKYGKGQLNWVGSNKRHSMATD